jgi:hypothetical protein
MLFSLNHLRDSIISGIFPMPSRFGSNRNPVRPSTPNQHHSMTTCLQ